MAKILIIVKEVLRDDLSMATGNSLKEIQSSLRVETRKGQRQGSLSGN